MKKLTVILTLVCFNAVSGISFDMPLPQQERFGPQTELLQQEFGKPKDMINIVPHRPVSARDKYGNRLYFTPDGKLTLRVSKDGSREFSLSVKSKEVDKEGTVQKITEKQRGKNISIIKNEKGEVLGYQELGLGGKVIREYDKDMNLIKSYRYNTYGKNAVLVFDERSQLTTVFDNKGRPIADINNEGTEVAWYIYNENNIIKLKRDIFGNKTYFDEKGKILYTEDQFGNVLEKYYYTKDENGNEVIEKSVNSLGNVTYYKNNRPVIEKDSNGEIITEYTYNGTTLVNSFNRKNNMVTWYDIDGRLLYISYDDQKVKEYLYSEGKLIGIFDWTNNSLSVIIHNQEVAKLLVKEKPTAEQIGVWLSKGYIKKEYSSNQPLAETSYKTKLASQMSSLYHPRNLVTVKSKDNRELTGYYNKDDDFITVQITYFNKNGLVEKKEDLISGKIQEFDTKGKLVRTYSKLVVVEGGREVEKIYEAKISYNKDGSYSISYKGIIDKDGDPNTKSDVELIEDAQVETYNFDGRLLSVVSKSFVDGEYKSSIKNFIYDASGNLISTERRSEDGEIIEQNSYKNNLNEGSRSSKRFSQNFYDGMKLVKTENYEISKDNNEDKKLLTTVYYDEHQRISEVFDSLGRLIQKYFYNDTKHPVVESIKISGRQVPITEVKILSGGILYSENYTYIDDTLQYKTRTYYHNGNPENPATSYLCN